MSSGGKRRGRFDREELMATLGEIDPEIRESLRDEDAEETLRLAEAAREEYDYERARSLYKLAVLFSSGDADAVCRLATFLVDEYAIFDEAIRILGSPSCEVTDRSLRLLARAHFLAGHSEEALAVYQEVNAAGGDALSWKRQGKLLFDAGRFEEALQALDRALSHDPTDAEAERLRSGCFEKLASDVEPILEAAGTALADGRLADADATLAELGSRSHLPPAYHRLRAQVDGRLAEERLAGLLDAGSELEAEGEVGAALDRYREALAADPQCELAAQKVAELENRMALSASREWLRKGEAAAADGDLDGAVQAFYMAVTRDETVGAGKPECAGLLDIVRQYHREVGRLPEKAQTAAIVALFRADEKLRTGNLPGAQLEASRAGTLLDALPAGRQVREALAREEREEQIRQAAGWLAEADALAAQGRRDDAASLYDRVARVPGFPEAAAAADKARSLRAGATLERERENALASIESLVAEEQFFLALRQLDGSRDLLDGMDAVNELRRAASEGVVRKYPLAPRQFPPALRETARYRTGTDRLDGFVPETTRVLQAVPDGSEWFVLSGRSLVVVDSAELRTKLSVEMPPQADLTDKKGFALTDIAPGDRAALVIVNFDDDLLLYFSYRRGQFELLNALPLERFIQQSRRKVTRHFTLNGPEEHLVVAQAPQGGGGETNLYALSLLDGRLEHNDELGYAMANLRRVPAGPARYVIHRMPEPMLMRRPNYYSMLFLDARLRVQERMHIGPEELEGTLIESTRWMRIGPASGNRYFLFRYFDSFSGQLVGRPLAFVAQSPKKELLYTAPDSSTLVRNAGDLDPIGEVLVKDGVEYMVVIGRKKEDQTLFVIDLSRFRLQEKHELDADWRCVAVTPGNNPGSIVLISLHAKTGEVQLERREVL